MSSKNVFSRREKKQFRTGILMISPWVIGFILFLFIPLVISVFMSLTNYTVLTPPEFVGLDNYITILTDDPLIWKSLGITFLYAVTAVPCQLVFGFALANLLNLKLKGMTFFRTIFYVPTLVVSVSAALLWKQMLGTDFGVVNYVLGLFGIAKIAWLDGLKEVIISVMLISLWQSGKMMIINLAGLQSIPTELYEAADIDGCGKLRQIFVITLPLTTPVLFMNLLLGLIGAFKSFTMFRVLTDGGPNDSSLVYMLYLYRNAFQNYKLGYANAMSIVLFVIVGILTVIVYKSSKSWVYYGGEK